METTLKGRRLHLQSDLNGNFQINTIQGDQPSECGICVDHFSLITHKDLKVKKFISMETLIIL